MSESRAFAERLVAEVEKIIPRSADEKPLSYYLRCLQWIISTDQGRELAAEVRRKMETERSAVTR